MTTRITGLATGLDIDSLVKTTMQAYQTKIDQQTQKKDVLEIQQKLYRDLVTKSQDFFNKYLDRSSKDCLRNSASYTSVKFTATNSSGVTSSAVTVKGLAGAEAQNYKVNVTQVAQKASKTLKEADIANAKAIRINGVSIATTKAGETEGTTVKKTNSELIDDINKELKDNGITNVKAKYSDFSKGIVIESTDTGRTSGFSLGVIADGSQSGITEGTNTMTSTTDVVQGVNGTAGSKEYTTNELRLMTDITIEKDGVSKTISLTGINNNPDYLGDDKKADYLNAVKTAIDQAFIEDENYKQTAVNTIVDSTGDGKLTLQSKEIGYDKVFTVNSADVRGTDPIEAYSSLSTDELKRASKITINDVEIDLTGVNAATYADDTEYIRAAAQQIYDTINANDTNKTKSGGIDVAPGSGYVSLITKEGGADKKISLSMKDSSGEDIHFSYGTNDIRIEGTDAIAILTNQNGDEYTYCGDKNSVTIDNTNFTFNDVTDGEVRVAGTNDASDLKDKLVKFIDDYNTLITDLNKAIMTKHDKNYSPLTADQKKEMTESQIKLWEDKVEEGQLYRDSDLTRIADSLKTTMRSVMNSTGQRLESIGIKPYQDYGGTKNGTFYIEDEDKLKEAIEENPEDVMNLFIGGTVTNVTAGDGNTGILNQLYYTINKEMFGSSSSLSKKVGFEGTSTFTNNTITNDISDYETKIKDMQKQYTTKEQALYSKYSTLETAMNKYNSQLSYLTSAFSS